MTMHIMREKIRSQWKTIEWDVEISRVLVDFGFDG